MSNSIDLFLGAFLIFSGFTLSLYNLRRVLKDNKFSAVLLSENIILMCIGLAFVVRAVHNLNIVNAVVNNVEERVAEFMVSRKYIEMNCSFWSLLMNYGPLIVSMVNSFMSLIIDNYMHYKMLGEIKDKDEENTVREMRDVQINRKVHINKVIQFWKKYFSFVMIALQWIIPILVALVMYPMGVSMMEVTHNDLRSEGTSCMAMLDYSNDSCSESNNKTIYTSELPKYFLAPNNFLEANENHNFDHNTSLDIDSVITKVLNIITNEKNDSFLGINVTSTTLYRKPKSEKNCPKICYIDNKNLLLYMFVLSITSYFVPVTISTIILTKIHIMDVNKPHVKTYVSRELIYNILFWTPVMLDNFLSLIMCSYSTNGLRSSLFNVIANVYQAVKNFMNTKYFHDNSVSPV